MFVKKQMVLLMIEEFMNGSNFVFDFVNLFNNKCNDISLN